MWKFTIKILYYYISGDALLLDASGMWNEDSDEA